nr:hypothetical protein [Tanacetum cinerariifolium]
MPSFPSSEPKVSCFDDLDFFKDFENEFPAIVYNDALTSKSDFLTKPSLSPYYIDEFVLKDETSMSEYDEVEQNVLYFNDLFPFNISYPNDLKLDKDNDDNKIDIIQPSRDVNIMAWNYLKNEMLRIALRIYTCRLASCSTLNGNIRIMFTQEYCGGQDMAPLPPRDQRYLWLRYQVEGYTEEIVHDSKDRLKTIFGSQVNRVHVLDFKGLTLEMRQDLTERLRMFVSLYSSSPALAGSVARWGLDTAEALSFQLGEMEKEGFKAYWLGSERVIPDKGDHSDYWIEISFDRDFLRAAPSYTYIRDPVRRLCHMTPEKVTTTDLFYLLSMDQGAYLLAQYLFNHAEGRKSSAMLLGGHFIRRLAHHFGQGAERQPVTAAAAPGDVEDAQTLIRVLRLFQNLYMYPHHHLQLRLYDAAHEGYWTYLSSIRWDLLRELPNGLRETQQTGDWGR